MLPNSSKALAQALVNLPAASQISDKLECASAAVTQRIAFVERVMEAHPWASEQKGRLAASLTTIERRKQDQSLYLAIVGEFNAGKSTLINALMGVELLASDILPATTCAVTMLQHRDRFTLEAKRNDGVKFHPKACDDVDRLRAWLQRLTADEQISSRLESVKVGLPSAALADGLVIVDTPGTNVDNERHVSVTRWAVREVCDAVVVVIPADIPASQSLLDFVDSHLKEVLHRCLFVVTKLDGIREEEQGWLLRTVAGRISALGFKHPKVLPGYSLLALNAANGLSWNEAAPHLNERLCERYLSQFEETKNLIYALLRRQRSLIIVEKLNSLMTDLLDGLQFDLGEMEKSYLDRHRVLEEKQIVDLAVYTRDQKAKHKSLLRGSLRKVKRELELKITRAEKELLEKLRRCIFTASSTGDLTQALESEPDRLLRTAQKRARKQLAEALRRLSAEASAQAEGFEKEFQGLYTSLATLGGRLKVNEKRTKATISGLRFEAVEDLNRVSLELIAQDQSSDMKALGAGAGIGAIIGSLLPGVGTLIGGLIGSYIGTRFMTSLEDLKSQCWEQMRSSVKKSLSEARHQLRQSLSQNHKHLEENLERIIDLYSTRYSDLVLKMIDRDRQESKNLKRQREAAQRQLAELAQHRNDLDHLRMQLKQM